MSCPKKSSIVIIDDVGNHYFFFCTSRTGTSRNRARRRPVRENITSAGEKKFDASKGNSMKKALVVLLLVFIPFLPLHAWGKKGITGYGPFDFAGTISPGEVERAGGAQLSAIEKGQNYSFRSYERFEGLVDFLQYYKMGKITPARQSGSVPKITATEVRLEDEKLRLIILYFNPNDYDEYLRVIRLEQGEPTAPSRKKKGTLRKDLWLSGESCIILQQVTMENIASGGQLKIQKDRCEGARSAK